MIDSAVRSVLAMPISVNALQDAASRENTKRRASLLHEYAATFLAHTPALPFPGSGQTRARWRALAELGGQDLCLVKLLEAHYDAQAILAELGGEAPRPGELWAVWAAEPPGLPLEFHAAVSSNGRLTGTKAWCSGADLVTHALVTAHRGGERVLCRMAMDSARMHYDDSRWRPVGMAGISSGTLELKDVRARSVGEDGAYLKRPGFWHGGAGIAACWYGGAVAVAERLRGEPKISSRPHAAAHLGAIDVALAGARAVLLQTADLIDSEPLQPHRHAVVRARSLVESACRDVVDRVGRALGAGPLCTEGTHAQRCADLLTFVRQHHAENDLQQLGEASAAAKDSPWTL